MKSDIREINNQPYSIFSYLKRLRNYKYLVASLSKRELKLKYSRAFLGLGWVFIQPIMAVIVYSIFFNNFIKIDTNSIPYTSFVFSGLVFWYAFTGIISRGCNALLESQDLINKVSFPRIILLFAKSVPVIVEGIVLFVILLVVAVIQGADITIHALWTLFYFLEIIIFSFALAILFSIWTVRVRDLLQVIPFLISFGIWLTPVFYPVSIIPAEYQPYIQYLNPVANAIDGLRDSLFLGKTVHFSSVIIMLVSLIILLLSFVFFIKFEKKMLEKL